MDVKEDFLHLFILSPGVCVTNKTGFGFDARICWTGYKSSQITI
jgi:hypothetical protein